MKKLLILAFTLVFVNRGESQILKKILDRTKQKTEDKVSEKVSEKVSDAATKPIDHTEIKRGSNKTNSTQATTNPQKAILKNEGNASVEPSFATYSKYDFVSGDKVLVMEDFSQDAVGDFPAKWNTNGSAEIVTAANQPGHWLMMAKRGRFIPEYINALPENFTFEFDLLCNDNFNFYSDALQTVFLTGPAGKKLFEWAAIQIDKRSCVSVSLHPTDAGNRAGTGKVDTYEDGEKVITNEVISNQFTTAEGHTKAHIAIWRQRTRLRVYVNQEKILDVPKAFVTDKPYTTVMYDLWADMNNKEDRYLVSNIKLAVGAPDTRNKLISEGRFVSHGILFDVGSDVIKPQSYGAVKEIADVLKDNTSLRVKIIGHTDSDGSSADNLTLSRRRATAVKTMLSDSFGIEAERLETDGKGATQPVDKNTTPEGKANNRRVEFVKM